MRHSTATRACPPTTLVLGYMTLAYISAGTLYWVITRFIGTPFANSLSAEQRKIKSDSARIRGGVFALSAIVAALALAMVRPIG